MTEIEYLATKQGEEEARKKDEETKAVINVEDLSQNERNYTRYLIVIHDTAKHLLMDTFQKRINYQ